MLEGLSVCGVGGYIIDDDDDDDNNGDEFSLSCNFPSLLENDSNAANNDDKKRKPSNKATTAATTTTSNSTSTNTTSKTLEEMDGGGPWLIYDPCYTKSSEEREPTIQYFPSCYGTNTNTNTTTIPSRRNSIKNMTNNNNTPNLLEDSLFEILNTQYSYEETDGLVLRPDIMEGIQSHLPIIKRGESFWLQYSLVRDGANMECLLNKTRKIEHSVLAIETIDGERFGAYCTNKWEIQHDFFGSRDSFLWRLGSSAVDGYDGDGDDDNDGDGDDDNLEIFHYSHLNEDVQLCTPTQLAVGGGNKKLDPGYGFGISLDQDLQTGTTNKCLTFCSPPLSRIHKDGTFFEVRNIEIWSLTPCLSLEEAERVQNGIWHK